MRLLMRIILPVAIATFLIDRLSKWWVVDILELPLQPQGRIEIWPPFLTFQMAWNEGINFGLFGGASKWMLIGVAVAISLALVIWTMRRAGGRSIALGTGLVVGGALGNAWDRATDWGAVADFLNMSCCGIDNPYSFNVADTAIFAGALWIAFRA